MAGARDINGVGVGVAAAGVVLVYAGIRRITLIDAFKDLAMGKAPTPNPKDPWADIAFEVGAVAGGPPLDLAAGGMVLQMAQQVAESPAGRSPYCWGGGHSGSPCSAKCFDCSGYVSCVLGKLGVLKGSMVTTQFMVWKGASTVPFEQRQPGDLWVSSGHIAIIVDDRQIIHAACTGCGPVKVSGYKKDRRFAVRRVKLPGRTNQPAAPPAPSYGVI